MEGLVRFRCVSVGGKLRVRVISPNYNPNANCQFPRSIRQNGCEYVAPRSALKFARGPAGKFFYRVAAKQIEIAPDNHDESAIGQQQVAVVRIYELDDTCSICLSEPPQLVFVPCGHYCVCIDCDEQLKVKYRNRRCPMCRSDIQQAVTKDQIQT